MFINWHRPASGIAALLTLLCCLHAGSVPARTALPLAPQTEAKNILLLYSYGAGGKGIAVFDDGLVATLSAGGVGVNNLFFEFLDLERNEADPQYRPRIRHLLEQKYVDRHIDLVITVQQPALNFLQNEGRHIAPGAPAITLQAPMPSATEAGTRRYVSLLTRFDIKGTLERALQLFPDTRRVVFVSGSSEADRKMVADAARIAAAWQGKLAFEYTFDLPLETLLKRVASLPPHTFIIFTQYNQDVSGNVTVAYEVEGRVVKAANAPVFGLYDFNLVNGGIGGSVVAVKELGKTTGKLALELLNGKLRLTQAVNRIDIPSIPMFDWSQIKRWGGDLNGLPGDSVVINRLPTFWQQYRAYVIGLATFILLQFLLIAALLVNMRRRAQAEQAIRESDERNQSLLAVSPDGIWIHNKARIEYVNDALVKMLGYGSMQDFVGRTIYEFFVPEFREALRERVANIAITLGRAPLTETVMLCRDASRLEVETTASAFQQGDEIRTISIIRDITARRKTEDRIEKLAFFDQLTGLANRALLLDRLRQTMAASSRSGDYGALLFIDLDNFKALNDTSGHDTGDLLLQQVAQRLTLSVREGDTVARFGGDEFVVILAGLSTAEGEAAAAVETVAEKILASINRTFQLGNVSHQSTASMGVTLFRGDLASIDDLMKQADLALYKAKGAGRNTFRFFDLQMESAVRERAALESDLRRALEEKQFLLHYQAQVTGEGRATGAEVLVRWQHPLRGMVFPAEFIPLSEETGLILALGNSVLEIACTQLAVWAGQPEMAHLTVAVNVSAYQFHQRDFVDQVLKVLDDTGANPERLKLELTESLLVSNIEEVIEKMFALKAKGVGFSLDDFGTGYSSLSYLKRLPLDHLKIDKSFVRDVLSDPNDAAIARTIIALARSLGLGVMAEGVETAAQRDFLAGSGCHTYQGYFFSRPLPIEDFEAFARRAAPSGA